MQSLSGKGASVSRPSAFPPPPVVFLRDPGLLPRIRSEITGPPDPDILPWESLPEYDADAVTRRLRLEKAAREKKAAPEPPEPPPPVQVPSAFQAALPRSASPQSEVQVDFSTAGNFFQKAHLATGSRRAEPETPEPPEAGPTFGFATGGRPRKKTAEKEPEVRKKPRAREEDFLSRLKTEFRRSD